MFEDLGILPRVKRFAGTSVGSIMAAILAAGGTSAEIKTIMFENNIADLIYGNTTLMSITLGGQTLKL